MFRQIFDIPGKKGADVNITKLLLNQLMSIIEAVILPLWIHSQTEGIRAITGGYTVNTCKE